MCTNYMLNMAQIVNIFAKVTFKIQFDLNTLVLHLDEAVYNERRFNGLVYKLKNPKASFVIFKSGNVIATGIKTEKDLDEAVRCLYKNLRKTGLFVDLIFPQVKITNLTASHNANAKFNLPQFYKRYQKFCVFEPELFPALKFQFKSPKLSVLIFHTGSLIFTGTSNNFVIQKYYRSIIIMLSDFLI